MTLKKELNNDIRIKKSNTSLFRSPYSEEEKEAIARFFKGNREIDLFNGINVRLEEMAELDRATELTVSITSFFDLLSTNILLLNYDKWVSSADTTMRELISKEKKLFDRDGEPNSLEDIISRNYLSNAMAVSVLIFDSKGNYLFTKRNNKVAISSNMASVSTTGAIDGEDYCCDNPILECARREVKEELEVEIQSNQIEIREIVAGKSKMQPIVLCDVQIDDVVMAVEIIKQRSCFITEHSEICVVKKENLKQFLQDNSFTEAATEHIMLHL